MAQCDAGPRMEPPVSEPREPRQRPAARAAPEPLLEPPGMWSVFQGLRAGGNACSALGPPKANSCMDSLPSRVVPASASLVVQTESASGTQSIKTLECAVVLMPLV